MRDAIIALQGRRTEGRHPGLLLQRYLCEPATGDQGDPREKRDLLDAAIEAAKHSDVRELYQAAFERWSAMLPNGRVTVDLCTEGRLIVGLGSENVIETGITLHHTYGTPIIPGSAIKGLAAHYCHEVWGAVDEHYKRPTPDEEKAYRDWLKIGDEPGPPYNFHRLLFGNTDDGGCVVFHDAWLAPGSPETLVLDVITPHHPGWLDGKVPPTDFDNPTPVPFLSVTGRFRVAVSWRGPESDQAGKWTQRALDLLCEALKEWGAGGKTTSGYGRLVPPPPPPPPPPPKPWRERDEVDVTILERKDASGKVQFRVQEPGVEKRGMLMAGNPPAQLPEIESVVRVYRNNTDRNNPQYRWDRSDSGGNKGARRSPGSGRR